MNARIDVPRTTITVTLELTIPELVSMLSDLEENISYGILDELKDELKAALD